MIDVASSICSIVDLYLPNKKSHEQRNKANRAHTIAHVEVKHRRLLKVPGRGDRDPKGDQQKGKAHEKTEARLFLYKDGCVIQADGKTDYTAQKAHGNTPFFLMHFHLTSSGLRGRLSPLGAAGVPDLSRPA
jgi:hypothetical protein